MPAFDPQAMPHQDGSVPCLDHIARSIDVRFTASEERIDQILANHLRWTLVSMILVLAPFAWLILALG